MTKAIDVASYIYALDPDVDKLKMQKLLYYVQGWSMCRLNAPAFEDRIEAWKRGPVVASVYRKCGDPPWAGRDMKSVESRLCGEVKTNAEAVVKFFRSYSSDKLADRTHSETPWSEAYDKGQNTEITRDSLKEYFCNPRNFFSDPNNFDKNSEYVIMTQAGVLKRLEDM